MALPIRPTHLKHYKAVAKLFIRHWGEDWFEGGSEVLKEPAVAVGGSEEEEESSSSLADDLESLGPTYVKLGQTLSTRPDVAPESVRKDLERLQDDVAPVPFAEIRERVESELGSSLNNLFSDFEEEPMGAASLGQVHRARLRDGREVAVKILRPGIRETVQNDLAAMGDMADWIEEHTELESRHGLCSMLREFDMALRRELDYTREADSLRRIRDILEPYDRIVVPRVIEDYSTSVVLTMEYIDGTNLGRLSPVAKLGKDMGPLADELFRGYLDQALLHGFVHADPHPGNLMLTRDGRLGIIDLGMVTVLPRDLRERLLRLLLALAEGDGSGAARIAERIGHKLDDYDGLAFRSELASLIAIHDHPDVSGIELGRVIMETVRVAGANGLRVPAELSLLGKTLLNLESVVKILHPQFRPDQVIREHAIFLVGGRTLDDADPGSILRKGLELKRLAEDLPGRIDTIMETLGEGRFQVAVEIKGEERIVDALTRFANRVTQGLVLAALVIGASLLMRVETRFTILGYPGLAILLFLLAVVAAAHLLWQIAFRSSPDHDTP